MKGNLKQRTIKGLLAVFDSLTVPARYKRKFTTGGRCKGYETFFHQQLTCILSLWHNRGLNLRIFYIHSMASVFARTWSSIRSGITWPEVSQSQERYVLPMMQKRLIIVAIPNTISTLLQRKSCLKNLMRRHPCHGNLFNLSDVRRSHCHGVQNKMAKPPNNVIQTRE